MPEAGNNPFFRIPTSEFKLFRLQNSSVFKYSKILVRYIAI